MIRDIFSEEIILEDERALLRPLKADDEKWLMPFALQEPDLWAFSLISPAGEAGMKRYITDALHEREKKLEYPFIVFDKQTNTCAGSTRFYDIQLKNDAVQLGYTWYGKAFQRSGLNRHCKLLLLDFAFNNWQAERVEFRADFNNKRSIEAMKAIGCVEEGVLRKHAPTDRGTRRTSMVLSILKEEWLGSVRDALVQKIR
jgi:N-acetyltransferase